MSIILLIFALSLTLKIITMKQSIAPLLREFKIYSAIDFLYRICAFSEVESAKIITTGKKPYLLIDGKGHDNNKEINVYISECQIHIKAYNSNKKLRINKYIDRKNDTSN